MDIFSSSTTYIIAIGYFLLIWIASMVWVARDIIHRTHKTTLQLLSLALNLIPILGLIIYLIIRPEKTLLEKYHDELERRMFGERGLYCSECGFLEHKDAEFCSDCGASLYNSCNECNKKIRKGGMFCEFCGNSVSSNNPIASKKDEVKKEHNFEVKKK